VSDHGSVHSESLISHNLQCPTLTRNTGVIRGEFRSRFS
jgi:hypothetical protein